MPILFRPLLDDFWTGNVAPMAFQSDASQAQSHFESSRSYQKDNIINTEMPFQQSFILECAIINNRKASSARSHPRDDQHLAPFFLHELHVPQPYYFSSSRVMVYFQISTAQHDKHSHLCHIVHTDE